MQASLLISILAICLLGQISTSLGDDVVLSLGNQIFHPDRIVGGEDAEKLEFPCIMSLRYGTHHICGAAIINPNWIMTAAHCSQNAASRYTAVAGAYNFSQPSGFEQKVTVTKVVVHSNYVANTVANDIALMQVSPPFEYNDHVQPVTLPPADFVQGGPGTVIGWGTLSSGGVSSNTLQKVTVPFVDHAKCQGAYAGVNSILDSMTCYGKKGMDSCQGDSGGPLFSNVNGQFVQAGIVSWGYGCAEANYPGVYTSVSAFLPFIQNVTSTG